MENSVVSSEEIRPYGASRNAPGYISLNDNFCLIPDPLKSTTKVFSASLNVYEIGLTDSAGGVYLIAGRDAWLMGHHWVDRGEAAEGSYYSDGS